jgi:catechol-2,3-dioxygenase
MAIKLERIGHVNLTVSDLARSMAFYQMLGFEVVEQDPVHDPHGGCFMALPGDGHTVDLGPVADTANPSTPPRGRDKVGVMHIAFKVGSYEALQEAHQTLIDNGVPIRSMIDHVSQRSVYFSDSDGTALEVYYEYPTAKMMMAMGRGDRDEAFAIDDPLPAYATYAGAAAAPGEWRQG